MTTPAAEKAINKLLNAYQKLADEEKAAGPAREAAQQKIEGLVDDLAALGSYDETKVTDEMMAAFAVFRQSAMQRMMQGDPSAQMAFAKFGDSFMEGLNNAFKAMQSDPARLQGIQQAANDLTKDLQPPKIQKGALMFDVAVDKPEDDIGEWTIAVVPVIIDENYQAKIVEKPEFDLTLSMNVSPRDSGLTEKFNIPASFTREGDKYEPLVLTTEVTEANPTRHLFINGSIHKDGRLQQVLSFPPIAVGRPEKPDMNAMMQMFGKGGPGPNGPN